MDKYQSLLIVVSVIVILVATWVMFFLSVKVDSSTFPTLVNGITSSTSIIIGLSGVVVGIMLRDAEIDRETRNFCYGVIVLLLIPLTMLWLTYSFLAMDTLGSVISYIAVRTALIALIETLYTFFGIVLYTVRSARIEHS